MAHDNPTRFDSDYNLLLDLKGELTDAKRSLDDLKAQLELLKNLKATLDAQKADITDICGRLDRFAAIWGFVRCTPLLLYIG